MRNITKIYIHCSATKEGVDYDVSWLRGVHRARGFYDIGYHYVVYLDGSIHKGRPVQEMGAHVKGDNENTMGVCYIGGLDSNGKPKDTRTVMQIHALRACIDMLKIDYPDVEVWGHRDASPDLNHDGVITPDEWMKVCPCWDVKTEL